MKSDDVKAGLMLAAAGAAVYLAWRAYAGAGSAAGTIKDAASTVGGWINPAADTNLVYQGVNGIGSFLTGDTDYSLGGAIYEVTHNGSLNPASPDNIVYTGFNGVGAWYTGQPGWNLGGAIYDATHKEPPAIQSGGGGIFKGNGATGTW